MLIPFGHRWLRAADIRCVSARRLGKGGLLHVDFDDGRKVHSYGLEFASLEGARAMADAIATQINGECAAAR